MRDLTQHIQSTPLMDTHEHLSKESAWVNDGPDVLADLFAGYIGSDLISAGAAPGAVARAQDAHDPDLAARWEGIAAAWDHCRTTGYGEGVRLQARLIYGIEEITLPALEGAAATNAALRQPGERLRLLREQANLDHVQVDDFEWACLPDESGPDFFLYDLSWVGFCRGDINAPALHQATGIDVHNLDSLRQAMAALFDKYAACAIAVKSQHAYQRTLHWHERTDSEAEAVLQKVLRGEDVRADDLLCLGDWGWARGLELAIEHNLPFKIHTGYHAGNGTMHDPDGLRAGHFARLIQRYPAARFVLMHTAYPYGGEAAALAKHFPNVYLDLCWAWAINPFNTMAFVRRVIHSVPRNKLFVFGGDTFWPTASVAYAAQARAWLNRTLQAEIDEGLLNEAEAIALVTQLMQENQRACFDLDGTRAAIHAQLAARVGQP